MNAQAVVSYLLELNVLNLEDIKRQLNNLAARSRYPEVKKWLHSVARNYIVNLEGEAVDDEYQPYTTKRPKKGIHTDMPGEDRLPDWAKRTMQADPKAKIHFFDPVQPRRRKFWQTLETIVDWFNSWPPNDPALKRIDRVSFEQAAQGATQWLEDISTKMQEDPWRFIKDNPPVVKEYDNGVRWVQLVKWPHFQRESYRRPDDSVPDCSLGHCVGTGPGYFNKSQAGTHQYYSLRDPQNRPHATLEVHGDTSVLQAKGHGNQKPVAKWQPYIVDFIQERGWDILGDRHNIDMNGAGTGEEG